MTDTRQEGQAAWEAASLLRTFQTGLGNSREQCDEHGKLMWDRVDAACTALSNLPVVPAGQAVGERISNVVGVDKGALKMALNVLRRAGKDEVANELQLSAFFISAIEASSPTAAAAGQEPVAQVDFDYAGGVKWLCHYAHIPKGSPLYTSPQADALDGARYRLLRDENSEIDAAREIYVVRKPAPFREDQTEEALFGEELDAILDAAMKGQTHDR